MKNSKSRSPLIILFSIILLVLSSCEQEDFTYELSNSNHFGARSDVQTLAPATIDVDNGVLIFKNFESYRNCLNTLQMMEKDELINWEKSLQFKSMFSIFQDVIEAEWNNQGPNRSEEYKDALTSGLIRESDELYELNLFNPIYAYVLNSQGIVKIDNDLYQMTSNELKIWNAGKTAQRNILVETKQNTSAISVYTFEKDALSAVHKSLDWFETCQSESRKYKLVTEVKFKSYYKDPKVQSTLFVDCTINAKMLCKTTRGNKIDPYAFIDLSGKSTIELAILQNNMVTLDLQTSNDNLQSRNGYLVFTPDVSGIYALRDRASFAKPAILKSADWKITAISSTREILRCGITK